MSVIGFVANVVGENHNCCHRHFKNFDNATKITGADIKASEFLLLFLLWLIEDKT